MQHRIVLILIALLVCETASAGRVSGYTRKNGTYVAPYYRSTANPTALDNYSYKGNINPYTGAVGTSTRLDHGDVGYVAPYYRPTANPTALGNHGYKSNITPYTSAVGTRTRRDHDDSGYVAPEYESIFDRLFSHAPKATPAPVNPPTPVALPAVSTASAAAEEAKPRAYPHDSEPQPASVQASHYDAWRDTRPFHMYQDQDGHIVMSNDGTPDPAYHRMPDSP